MYHHFKTCPLLLTKNCWQSKHRNWITDINKSNYGILPPLYLQSQKELSECYCGQKRETQIKLESEKQWSTDLSKLFCKSLQNDLPRSVISNYQSTIQLSCEISNKSLFEKMTSFLFWLQCNKYIVRLARNTYYIEKQKFAFTLVKQSFYTSIWLLGRLCIFTLKISHNWKHESSTEIKAKNSF